MKTMFSFRFYLQIRIELLAMNFLFRKKSYNLEKWNVVFAKENSRKIRKCIFLVSVYPTPADNHCPHGWHPWDQPKDKTVFVK